MSYKNRTGLPTFGSDGPSEAEMIKSMVENVDAVVSGHQRIDSELSTLKSDVVSLRRMAGAGGPAGATSRGIDFEALGQFTKHVVGQRLNMPEMQKVAAPWSIDVDERGGFLVPVQVAGTIDAIMRPEGGLLARCVRHAVEPGRTFRVPSYSTAPVAGWQNTENTDLSEFDIAIAALDREPKALGGYLDISWQLLHQSAFAVGAGITTELVNAARQAFETAVVAGEGGVTAPWDGLIEAAGATQPALATPTSALVGKFINDTLEDQPAMMDTGVLAMHPAVYEAVAANDASSNYSSRLVVGPNGPRFGTFDVVRTPACPVTSIVMFDPKHVHLVGGGHTLLVDDRSQSKSLTVRLTFASWSGYGISLAAAVSKATITAMS